MRGNLRREDEAVSAAVATVLLFGGVLSIIGLMMVSMMPVIEEMEGSVERHDMSSQMTLLAHQTSALSERGMPGDSTHATLIPVDGNLVWDSMRGGMWYSATWQEDMSLRARSVLDFDDTMEIRHPESFVEAVCVTDLRLGPDRPYYYTLESVLDEVLFTVTPGLTMPLGPIDVSLTINGVEQQNVMLRVDEVDSFDLTTVDEAVLASTHALTVMGKTGESGATYVLPNAPEPSDKRGLAWSIPVSSGTANLHIISDTANQIHLTTDEGTTIHYALPSGLARTVVSFSHELTVSEDSIVHVTTSAPSRLLLKENTSSENGLTAWPSTTGAYLGHAFSPPNLNGTLRFTNPGDSVVTVTWRGGGISVAAGGHEHVQWPPAQGQGAATLDADGDLFVTWAASTSINTTDAQPGNMMLPADDTGALSGGMFTYTNEDNQTAETLLVRLAGYTSSWNASGVANQTGIFLDRNNHASLTAAEGTTTVAVEAGHPLRIFRSSGQAGLHLVPHDGADRCTSIGTQASGWITTDLPWERMGGRGEIDLQNAWIEGRHPASVSIDVLGSDGISTHASIGTVWSFHLSRLSYQFQSSIDGMEVAFSGGAVVTNHPEFKPYVVVPPSDRGGPGPRFAATVPSLHPTAESDSGAGELELDIELVHRMSLASTPAYEVRRGWSEPYGTAIADNAGIGLEASEDWTVYPGRLDLLTDYVGWVPDPSYGTAEAVWHTNGEVIEFTLQLASLDVTTREVLL
jgi:hypothetical protein